MTSTLVAIVLIIISIWIYNDSKKRNVSASVLWAIGAFILPYVIVPLYFILRPDKSQNNNDSLSNNSENSVSDSNLQIEENTKRIIKPVVVFLVVAVAMYMFFSSTQNIATSGRDSYSSTNFEYGYLDAGAIWQDSDDTVHTVYNKTKVEVWQREIISSKGQKLIQIYILEGRYAGYWGYTNKFFITKK